MNVLKQLAVIVLVAGLLPFVRASVLPNNCSALSGWRQSECQKILSDTSLNLEQKQDLYLNLIESQGKLASYDFVWRWNNAIEWDSAPTSVVSKSSGIIKNAWIKIVSIHKSFFDLNKQQWFVQSHGKVLTAYNFSIELPFGIESGDCKTNYSYQLLNEDLHVKLNGLAIGSNRVSNYSVFVVDGQPMSFQASLLVVVRLRVDHFKLVEHSWWAGGIFPHYEYYYTCEYGGTEFRQNSVFLGGKFNAKARVQRIGLKLRLSNIFGISEIIV